VKRSLVIGNANVGKTLFCLRFAAFLGLRQLRVFVERTDGKTEERLLTVEEAKQLLSSPESHHTRDLQPIALSVPRGKSNRQLLLTDTTGLTDGIHPDTAIRQAMAQTLSALASAQVILHVVDAARLGSEASESGKSSAWKPVDEQLAEYGQGCGSYLILANKMDLPGAKAGYQHLCKRFGKHRVVPVSALYGGGFREVKQHVWRFA
jgi:predicted GTPase